MIKISPIQTDCFDQGCAEENEEDRNNEGNPIRIKKYHSVGD
jgi:hypothetical protein